MFCRRIFTAPRLSLLPPFRSFFQPALRLSARPAIALPALCLAALALSGCGRGQAADAAAVPPAVEVDVATVVVKPVRQWDEFNGRIAAVDSAEIRPRISGYVERIAYTEGQAVKRGDLLFKIDDRPYQAALESATARLQRARAQASLAKSQAQRAQALLETQAISKDDAEIRQANQLQSDADVRDAEAALAVARLNLAFTDVRAPISGRAGRTQLTIGNLARADETVLTTVMSQDFVYVYFDPDEKSYLGYASARKAQGASAPMAVQVGLAHEPGFPHAGVVDFVENQVDPATGTIRTRARLKNEGRVFTPGLFARVRLGQDIETPAILIDEKAVLIDQSRKYVYGVGPDNKTWRKDITLGRASEGLRVVESGLAAGDKVVVGGVQRIYAAGTAVHATEVAMATAAAAH